MPKKYLLQLEHDSDGWMYTLYRWREPESGLNANGVYEEWDGGLLDDDHNFQHNEAIYEIRMAFDITDADELNIINI